MSILHRFMSAQSCDMGSPQYFRTLRSSWIHQHGIGGAEVLIILTITGARFLWERRGPARKFWSRAHWVLPLFVVGGVFSRGFLPEFNGLTQRVMYLGIYIWMQASFIRWVKEDDSARNRQWVEGIAEAFQDAAAGEL